MSEASRQKIHVVLTMNCLPAGGRRGVRGPERWDEAERAVAGFAAQLAERGLRATLYVAPEAAKRLRGVLEQAASAGHELGLLCHPQLSNYQTYLGAYSYERQREIVGVARRTWEDALGRAPETFRPGFFSANDYTFHVLCMEGFRQGSCSLPGRIDNDQCSMWFGSYPFPHHTDPLDRTAQGTMEFFEIPVSSDFEAVSYLSYETYTPPHLRIEEADVHEFAEDLLERLLDRMDEDEVAVRTVNLVTSNLVGWGKEDDPHAERLGNLCELLAEVAERRGAELAAATVAELHETWDAELGYPWPEEGAP